MNWGGDVSRERKQEWTGTDVSHGRGVHGVPRAFRKIQMKKIQVEHVRRPSAALASSANERGERQRERRDREGRRTGHVSAPLRP